MKRAGVAVVAVVALVCAAGCGDDDFELDLSVPHDDTVTGEEAFVAGGVAVGDAYDRIEGAPEVYRLFAIERGGGLVGVTD